jgi:hypothetical protein
MKRAVGILAMALVPMFGASLVIAADYGGSESRGSLSGAAGSAATAAQGYLGQHTMTGRITDIDKSDGSVTIQAEGGKEMDLHFPPSALQTLNEGDQVQVQLAIKPMSGARGTTSGAGTTGHGAGTGAGSGAGMRPGSGSGSGGMGGGPGTYEHGTGTETP